MSKSADRSAKKDSPRKINAAEVTQEEEKILHANSPEQVSHTGSPPLLNPNNIMHLQHLVGNQAVQRMMTPQTATNPDSDVQRDWGEGAIGGALIGGLVGGPIGALGGALVGGLIGGLTAKPTVDPKAVIKKAAESLVETGGTANESDKEVVVAEMIKIPLTALSALKKKGTKVVVCRNSVTEIREDLKGVKPRGWPEGKTWDNVPGLQDRENNRVIIATRNGKVPPTGDGHGAHNLVLHEVGHAIGEAVETGGENDARFIAAREKDKAQLDSYEGQAGSAGIEETYAESFARFYDNDPNDEKLYPNLHAYWASNPFVATK